MLQKITHLQAQVLFRPCQIKSFIERAERARYVEVALIELSGCKLLIYQTGAGQNQFYLSGYSKLGLDLDKTMRYIDSKLSLKTAKKLSKVSFTNRDVKTRATDILPNIVTLYEYLSVINEQIEVQDD